MASPSQSLHRVHRWPVVVLLVLTPVLAWLLMQVVHESGHVLMGWLTGGHVQRVVLHPQSISRTDLSLNPSPLVVSWAGPVWGVLAPVTLWGIAVWGKWPVQFWLRYFAGFCLIANGTYLVAGMAAGIGDAGDILRHGSAGWMLLLFGAITVPIGFRLWHGLGPAFGLGREQQSISPQCAWTILVLTVAVVLGEVCFSPCC